MLQRFPFRLPLKRDKRKTNPENSCSEEYYSKKKIRLPQKDPETCRRFSRPPLVSSRRHKNKRTAEKWRALKTDDYAWFNSSCYHTVLGNPRNRSPVLRVRDAPKYKTYLKVLGPFWDGITKGIETRIVNNFATTKSPGFSLYYRNTWQDTTHLDKRSWDFHFSGKNLFTIKFFFRLTFKVFQLLHFTAKCLPCFKANS